MSLQFGIATSDRVDVGTGATIQSLAQKTVLAWVFPTALVGGIWSKTNNAGVQNRMAVQDTVGNIRVLHATTVAGSYITNNAPIVKNKWNCVASSCTDVPATGRIHIYCGDIYTQLKECTYSSATDGSGTFGVDTTTNPMAWGNILSAAWQNAFNGYIYLGILWNRVLQLDELRTHQFRPNPKSLGCVLMTMLGANALGVQPDLSGNGNNGTITGARMAVNPVFTVPWSTQIKHMINAPAVPPPILMPWQLQGQMGGLIAQ